MKIAVVGLWHLGIVTAACLAKAGFEVIAYDRNEQIIDLLCNQQLPVAEPGVTEIFAAYHVVFSTTARYIADAEMVWITYDTPVDEDDHADINFVDNEIKNILPQLQANTLILISSQLPVGFTQKLQSFCQQHYAHKNLRCAYSPENLRLGKAIEIFTNPERIIVGVQHEQDKQLIAEVLTNFCENIIWMSVQSAEMTKHAINAFLATSVVFANELASLCEKVGADARDVERGLKSEARIGPQAYLKAGNAFAGGTLARDILFLQKIAKQYNQDVPLFNAVLISNELHKCWIQHSLQDVFVDLVGKKIALLGLTYKPGTDTLRRSSAITLAKWLHQQGATITAYDPAIKKLPTEYDFIQLGLSSVAALSNADAVIIATEWPEFAALSIDDLVGILRQPYIFDPNGFIAKNISQIPNINYFMVGNCI